jgi:two-component system chemotaxis response regulator CheY
MKIMIVDDAKLMRGLIKKALSAIPEVLLLEAENGAEGVELYKATKPDLVTMDITMDYKNGVEAAREILQTDPSAKIIMVTALGQENLLKESVDLGVKDFIVKPFSQERLLAAVGKVLNLKFAGG